ncbi:MAG: MFS transporter [Actinomyces urogenitalis]|uniref:Major facilitator superfamily (MFS) profile domain-containing protein n=3 Tax=Actinomyces urogenitalis TaxID=103621 RepID=A0A2I1KQV9_9ACTO|nr:MFS transporter [Actinomyces urogenitalis]MDU0973142.1 MFS transporter [Actinomyces urogenitalis]PKY97988.1 hypothetical protein CYJ26_09825 [Actinomyces urogenitalis]
MSHASSRPASDVPGAQDVFVLPDPRDAETVSPALAGSIFATAVLAFLGLFLETVVSVLFPALMEAFGVGTSQVQWLTSGYLLVVAIIMPLSSYLQRRFTARSLFFAAVAAVAAGSVIALAAPTFPVLLAGRLLQGVGTGIITPLMFTIILTQAPRTKFGALMGVGGLTLGVAPAVGPIVGGVIGEVASWRVVFAITLPLILASFVVGARSIQQARPTEKIALSWGQVVLLALAFVGLILGLERGGALLAAGADVELGVNASVTRLLETETSQDAARERTRVQVQVREAEAVAVEAGAPGSVLD